MNSELDQRPALEQYQCLLRWLENPRFASTDEAEDLINSIEEGIGGFFVVANRGVYNVYRISPHRHDVSNMFTFSQSDLFNLRQRAASDIGESTLTEMGI